MKIDIGNKTKNFNEWIKNKLKKNKKNLSKVKENIEFYEFLQMNSYTRKNDEFVWVLRK